MAITTLDGTIAGMQWPRYFAKAVTPTMVAGRPQSLWGLAGNPGAGAYDTTLNGIALSSTSSQVNGQINFVNPVSGNTYLARLQASATVAGTLLLCDRLWHNGGYNVTLTTAQASTTPTWPARDAFGATNGDGVLLGLEVSAATSTGTPTITVAYTDQVGTAGSATNVVATTTGATAGAFYPIGLAAGDTGVRSVQSLTLNATWTSGTINLVAYRPIAALELTSANTPNAIDSITAGFPRLFNGSVPFLVFIPSTTTASNVSGQVIWTQG
ncbi:MAG TPA: hypothetical protein VLG36_02265 [Candidatus Chromulinivoraceae bacterium]|nr:hypothetical protein [Candidatus Chromulinivoraceae bacterium]